jgi:hypothetical protein
VEKIKRCGLATIDRVTSVKAKLDAQEATDSWDGEERVESSVPMDQGNDKDQVKM